jgi:GT2 family glycosyltransferase
LFESPLVRVVSATQLTAEDFLRSSPLGQSMQRLAHDKRVCLAVAFENSAGLSEVFNRALALSDESEPDVLVFCHDDVRIDDIYLVDHVISGLNHFDVIGVAGAKARQKCQLVWAGVVDNYDPSTFVSLQDDGLLSGAVGSLAIDGRRGVDYFGPTASACELLDGVFFAARRSTLLKHQVFFDQQFKFHFYDLDFCRTARSMGLRLGTWPISVTHEYKTAGYFSSDWRNAAILYSAKWEK